jgi:hypothetical protein
MSQDWWYGLFVGGLVMTGVWGIAVLVIAGAIGNSHHHAATPPAPQVTDADLDRLLGRPDDQS